MQQNWSIFKKIACLFLFYYCLLYANSFQFFLTFLFEPFWQLVVPPFAKLFGYVRDITVFTNGSGDTTYNYYQILLFGILAIILAGITVVVDRKRPNYETLLSWLSVLIRYYLAAQLISYGLAKLYYMQFQYPSAARLDQELGDFSPMGLLWTFMGYSKGYTMFTGTLEFIGGILLLSRYTTTLGALTTFGVMLNVMLLNYCYDVPVKLLSTHLVFMSIFLIALDGQRLLNFFVLNQPVQPFLIPDIIPASYQSAKKIIKGIALAAYFGFAFYNMNMMSKKYGATAPKPYFAGKYQIESFERFPYFGMGKDKEGDLDDWKVLYQTWKGQAMVKTQDEYTVYLQIETDTIQQLFKIKSNTDTSFYELKYAWIGTDTVQINGFYENDSLNFVMVKEDVSGRLLVSRDFHWISEYPFNR